MTTTKLPTIAFIGLGIMGGPMAGHLLDGGHTVHLHSRTKQKPPFLGRVRVCR